MVASLETPSSRLLESNLLKKGKFLVSSDQLEERIESTVFETGRIARKFKG